MFSTHDRPSCPISEASNRLRLFNNLLLLQIFDIFMNCWIIRSAGELGHFKTCQFHDFGPQQVNIQLWSSSSRKAVILFLQLWKLCWCNWRYNNLFALSANTCAFKPHRTHFCRIFVSNAFLHFSWLGSKLQTCFVLCTSMMITFLVSSFWKPSSKVIKGLWPSFP